jgi:hypothetical protein
MQGLSLFEAAARAVATFREQPWATEALSPAAVLRVEVHAPPVVHEVPHKAVERLLHSPGGSPKEMATRLRQAQGESVKNREPRRAYGDMMTARLEDEMAVVVTRSAGMLLLSIWLILTGLAGLATIPIPGVLMAALALIAGVLILLGR